LDNGKINILNSFKLELGRLLILSFGVFLFILFFQPFPLEMLEYENRLLFVTGFAVIIFLVAFIILILLPLMVPKLFKVSDWEYGPSLFVSMLYLVLSSTAFAFYIRYVGRAELSFYIMFKVLLVNLLPLIFLIILYRYKYMREAVGILKEQNREYRLKIKDFENNQDEEEIDILSDNKSDKLNLKFRDIVFIKSADNYIEICFLEKGLVAKKMLRSTLKKIELQLANKRNFIRCHRTRIVNIKFIDKLIKSYGVHSLKLNCCDETIPVSRQYLMQVRIALTNFV